LINCFSKRNDTRKLRKYLCVRALPHESKLRRLHGDRVRSLSVVRGTYTVKRK
jgi:hypothetical protein